MSMWTHHTSKVNYVHMVLHCELSGEVGNLRVRSKLYCDVAQPGINEQRKSESVDMLALHFTFSILN